MKHVTATLALLLLMGAIVSAQPRGERGRQFFEELSLTDEQQKQVDDLRSAHQKSMIDHRAAIQKAQVEIRDLWNADSPNRSAIEKKMNEVADLRVKSATAMLDQWFAVNKILTPEQQKVWKKMPGMMAGKSGNRPMMRGMRMDRMNRMDRMHDGPGMHRQDRMHR